MTKPSAADRCAFLPLVLLFAILAMMPAFATAPSAQPARTEKAEKSDGYRYLNELRASAGMKPFRSNARLERASGNHANYLVANNTTGHGERKGRRGFTGATPWARSLAAGYPHRNVSENVNAGSKDLRESIAGLMTAIYHRFGFLAFDIDEVGLGFNRKTELKHYVFKMGNSLLARLCASPPQAALFKPPGTYVEMCPRKTRFRADYVEELTETLRKGNPRLVLWPPQSARGVAPAFYEESPDPLPDYGVSGNPLSIQFNPALVKKARIRSFRLFAHRGPIREGRVRSGNLTEVKNTRLLTEKSDPNRKFTALQFALFPLEQMEWGQAYVAKAAFDVDGEREEIVWHFSTEEPGAPLYRVAGKGEVFPVRKGRTYAFYLPPTRAKPSLAPFQTSFPQGAAPEVELKDNNTILVRFDGAPCSEVEFSVAGGRRFKVRVAKADNISRDNPPEVLYAGCGKYGADFRVAGKKETVEVRSGVTYRIHIQPRPGETGPGRFGWSYPRGVKMEGKIEPGNILRVKVKGKPCQVVNVKLSHGRTFRLRLAPAKGGARCR